MIPFNHRFLVKTSILVLLCLGKLKGQTSEIYISGAYTNIDFNEFVVEIENQYPVRFYYRPEWVDSLIVTGSFTHQPLGEVISSILKDTNLKYHHYKGNIFITDRINLKSNLFDKEKWISKASETEEILDSFYESVSATVNNQNLKNGGLPNTIELGRQNIRPGMANATLSGTIKERKTGETLPGVNIYIEELNTGTSTNVYGYYSLTIPVGEHTLIMQSLGMKKIEQKIQIFGNDNLDYELEEEVYPLKEVVIESEKSRNILGLETGLNRLDMRTARELPTNMGEVDIMRIALSLPGVQSSGEAASGFNVRGGTADQNLILLDKAVIFNSSHLFGFFSVFNPDIIKSTEMFKGSIPAIYGGRISSVFNITRRKGNINKFSGSGGISPVTARVSIEGPIKKDKTNYILGFRTTYSDWLLNQIKNDLFHKSEASFYDLNIGLEHVFNKKNSIDLSYYQSYDDFQLNSDTLYIQGNRTASVQWRHRFNQKLLGVFSGIYSGYKYRIISDEAFAQSFELGFDIDQVNLKADLSYYTDSNHELNFGLDAQYYHLNPGYIVPRDSASLFEPYRMKYENAFDYALYFSDRFEINPKLTVEAGLRYLLYHKIGPQNSYVYQEGVPRDENTIIDTLNYKNGEITKTYHGPELRLSFNYLFDLEKSIKFSFTQTSQVLHMITNSVAISPTDIWKLSDAYIPPSRAWQISAGYYQNMRNNTLEGSVEAYFKKSKNVLDYKGGADLILNDHIETDILPAEGYAYGIEFFLRKSYGKFNGWLSYSYSRSFLKTTGNYPEENVAGGNYYPSYVDRPHDLSLIANYKFTRRFSISGSLYYNTGRPVTIPVSRYLFEGKTRFYYSDRNDYRLPDYFRIDLSLKLEGNHKIKKLAHSSWIFSIYNLTGRDNIYSIYFISTKEQIKGYKVSVFTNPIPTLTYNFRF